MHHFDFQRGSTIFTLTRSITTSSKNRENIFSFFTNKAKQCQLNSVFNKKFDIRLFKPYLKSAENIVAFLAFGKIFGEDDVIKLLTRWIPNYRARFWWFVVKRYVFKNLKI